jgi:uncharacterized protein (DUF983 family)
MTVDRRHLPGVRDALRRGLSRRCPHCGTGPLFKGWADTLDACPSCGLVYERNAGDTWAFTILGDRLPIAAAVAAVYFGIVRHHWTIGMAVLAMLGVALFATAPNRWGVGIALHYLSRRVWPDPSDPIPQSDEPVET